VKTGCKLAPEGRPSGRDQNPTIVACQGAPGGLPLGAIGSSEEVMGLVGDGSVIQVGTFAANPLVLWRRQRGAARSPDVMMRSVDAVQRCARSGAPDDRLGNRRGQHPVQVGRRAGNGIGRQENRASTTLATHSTSGLAAKVPNLD